MEICLEFNGKGREHAWSLMASQYRVYLEGNMTQEGKDQFGTILILKADK